MAQRPLFEPLPWNPQDQSLAPLCHGSESWMPLISCAADFSIEIFENAVSQLIHHPEYNSTLILRSEVINESDSDFPELVPSFESLRNIRCIHRKLLPRRPGRDPSLEQYCTLYGDATDESACPDTLVLSPIIEPNGSLPYYHPTVFHLAFRYFSTNPPTLRIEVLPFPNTATDRSSRLYQTCLALLETLHRYGWGAVTNYKKRVLHDCLVPRETYQDVYLLLRERHKHLVDTWQEVTDPLKHVFEDIGIATFLMLLWRDSFADSESKETEEDPMQPWKTWPRPSGGFLDFGCGNGLLTHILTSEGYTGVGIDVRARSSWTQYPSSTQAALHVYAFDPTIADRTYFKPGVFIIGNHADELTPWTPVLSSLYDASGYISIPCCSWAFDAKFERSSTPAFPIPSDNFADSLNLGGDGSNKSSYSKYRIWLASLSLYCGWEVECETLRIPSTRNWAIVGRKQLKAMSTAEAKANVEEIVTGVKGRGLFKARKPEGKAGDH